VKYAFSASGSKLEFIGAKVTGKHDGSFGVFTGTIDVVDGKPEKSRVTAEIDTTSVDSDNDKLTGHLKSPDFFDVAKYPKARFNSTSIAPLTGGAGGATHTVTGNLELHGVTKSITFPAKIQISADAVDVDAEFAINRKDFGIVYPGAPDDLVKDNVLIKLTLRAGKATS
jgi:polyisoprenoid-binding protein YceI